MATAPRKSPRATIVNHNLVGQAETFLQDLPEKPKQDLSLREAIGQMQEEIKAALLKGYNYEELAQLLSSQGIKISPLTLKNYVPSGKRRAAASQPKRSKKSPDEAPAPGDPPVSVADEPAIAPEPESAPTKPRRGRTKTAEAAVSPVAADSQPQPKTSRARKTPANTTTRTTSTRRKKSATTP